MVTEAVLKRIWEINSDVSNEPPTTKQDCSDVVNISIFFDGTGNNKDADENKKQWSNPARLWRNARNYIDDNKKQDKGKSDYAIYVSGVGTKFNGELNIFEKPIAHIQDHYGLGAGLGAGGTRRLDYGEDQLNDALKQVIIANAKKAEIDIGKYANEKKVYSFAEVEKSLKKHRLIKKINISTFGFSRGAALARAFTNQLIWKCESNCNSLTYGSGKHPIEFKFLGIFDTVASFGLPAMNLNNYFGNRDLVVDDRVKMCVHHVAGNELRFAFPVDLIEKDGKLANSNWKEIVYPGMHSDVGGGYTPDSQEVNDNFARIPLKNMLTEAVNAGVRMYDYEQLKKDHSEIFEHQFEIAPETQRLYNAVQSQMQVSGKIQDRITTAMKVYYSAYGTMDRKGIESVSQRVRRKNKIRQFIPWGPSDMATEMNRLQKMKRGSASYKVFSLISTSYSYLIQMQDWILDSWNNDINDDVMKFYLDYIHDSKYGFLSNAEPFSYFRQRTIYESRRSRKGKKVDEEIKKNKEECDIVN